MGVTRTTLPFEGRFTQVPNAWARDQRLSRRARGLLLEIMSHRIGWHVSTRSLTRDGQEGRDAVRSMLAELVEAGYLVADQQRADGGRFGEIEYRLDDPHRDGKSDAEDDDDPRDDGDATVAGFSGRGAVTVAGETVAGLPVAGESDHKEEHLLEDHLSEHEEAPRKRGSRIPKGWNPSSAMRAYAATKAPSIDVDAEVENFRDYWTARSDAGAVKLDWDATWRTWVRRAHADNVRRGWRPALVVPEGQEWLAR